MIKETKPTRIYLQSITSHFPVVLMNTSLSQDPTVVMLVEALFRCHALDILTDQGECD